MPVDPHIQQLLDDLQASGAKSLSGMTIEEVRAARGGRFQSGRIDTARTGRC
jgi:hypothetical protein